MFSLIITIISIALVAALALATIYYGGDAFTRGGDAAAAAQLINEGQQLNGALTLATVDNVIETGDTVAELAPAYLSQIPAGWTTTTPLAGVGSGQFLVTEAVTPAVCQAVNANAGIVAADTAAVADTDVVGELVVAAGDIGVYGCVTATNLVQYSF